ncbi:hypothetical protein ACWGB8_36275 [Kitasatospora sp. NPDC054939]
MIHTPSLPEDLQTPERLWARAVTMAVVELAATGRTEYALDEDGFWCHSTGADGWWRLSRFDGGRAVFCGQDPDFSHTHLLDEPLDFLAGGPEWLPWELLKDDADGNLFGFLYWWQDGAWQRVDYPADVENDGLDGAAPWAGSDETEYTGLALSACDYYAAGEPGLLDAIRAFAARVEAGDADGAAVAELVAGLAAHGVPAPHADAALAFAARAGVTP